MNELIVSIVQYDQQWEDKPANRNILEGLLRNMTMPTDMIILPEMYDTGFTQNLAMSTTIDGAEVQWMKDKARQYNALIMGSLIIQEEGKYYNRMLAVFPDGHLHSYDKRHLFSLMDEDKDFSPGKTHKPFIYKGWNILPFICYDLRFPAWCYHASTADLMVFVANWPQKRHYHWTTLLQARSIENQCYVAGANRIGMDNLGNAYNGQSAVYDFWGNSLILAENLQTILTVSLSKDKLESHRADFPFWKDADKYTLHD